MMRRLAERFFRWFCHPSYFDEIQGDLEEMYSRNLEKGKQYAQWKYLLQVIILFRPSLMRSFSQNPLFNLGMYRNYFKISVRILLRQKLYATINILGLAVGMGVCLLIYQYIHFELSYDQFHTNAENIYRLTQTTIRNGENHGTEIFTTHGLGPNAKEVIPEITEFVRIRPQRNAPVVINPENEQSFLQENMWYVERNFLQLFNYPLKYGDSESALDGKYNIVLTEQAAIKYFGKTNPIGKSLRISLSILSGEFTVTGVLAALPANSHLQFECLLPITFVLEKHPFYSKEDSEGWGFTDFVTYVRINEATAINDIKVKFDQLVAAKAKGDAKDPGSEWKIDFQPLLAIHLESEFTKELAINNGDLQNVISFSIIAVFILLMAWVNYINLSTTQAIKRGKEVAIRKSIGAFKQQLVGQFITEAAIVNFIAATLAVALAYCMLPILNNIISKNIAFSVFWDIKFWWVSLSIIILGSLLSGLYPAFILSSFKPVAIFKSIEVMQKGGINLRKGLILFQFTISILLISATYLVYKQISYMRDQDLGVDMEKILIVNGPRLMLETSEMEEIETKYQAFKNTLTKHHAVSAVSGTSSFPSSGYYATEGYSRFDKEKSSDKQANLIVVDTDFINTYELDFIAKTDFPKKILPDDKVIINEEAVKVFGFSSAEDALHEVLVDNWGNTVEILGVVKDIHWSSLKDAHSPHIFVLNNSFVAYYSIKMNLSDVKETIAQIKSDYNTIFPDDPFEYSFLDDDFNAQYQADLQFGNLFSIFSILAIFIACLGLFALVSFSATLRMKEIGIRKVLGASISNLMIMLSREYLILLLIAIIVAIPVILIGGKAWLENYAFKIEMGFDLFLIPALALLLISLVTVSYRTYTTAKINPVESLKSE
ncbi:MAG: FtsX-like permease family protein [Bacteroidota bacterium]